MTNTSLEGTESANSGDVSVANDFRKVCLIRDPKSGGSAACYCYNVKSNKSY